MPWIWKLEQGHYPARKVGIEAFKASEKPRTALALFPIIHGTQQKNRCRNKNHMPKKEKQLVTSLELVVELAIPTFRLGGHSQVQNQTCQGVTFRSFLEVFEPATTQTTLLAKKLWHTLVLYHRHKSQQRLSLKEFGDKEDKGYKLKKARTLH